MPDVQPARTDEQAQSVTQDYRVQLRQHGGKWTTWVTAESYNQALDAYNLAVDSALAPRVRVLEVRRTLFVDVQVMDQSLQK